MRNNISSYLKNASEHGTLAHAHALIGPQSANTVGLVEEFLQSMFGAHPREHADIRFLEPENDTISIAAIRDARAWLSATPLAGDAKALVLVRAECMNTEAQNAFLKILEEPGKHVHIFLLTSTKRKILPTIYSRVVPLHCAATAAHEPVTGPEHLIHALIAADTAPERMRLWLSAGIPKEGIRAWLLESIPRLRAELAARQSPKLAEALRDTLQALARPQGQNWQLAAERLIISF